MGLPTYKAAGRRAARRIALIGLMLGGGLLTAGISQAQDIGAADAQERAAEAVAAAGGPIQGARLIPFAADKAAVETRDDDVAALPPPAPATPLTPGPNVPVGSGITPASAPGAAQTADDPTVRQVARVELTPPPQN